MHCLYCTIIFHPIFGGQMYCSTSCANRANLSHVPLVQFFSPKRLDVKFHDDNSYSLRISTNIPEHNILFNVKPQDKNSESILQEFFPEGLVNSEIEVIYEQ